MKKPSYDSTSTYLFYIALFVVGLSVISFLLTLILKSNIYIDFTSKGWSEFIEFYKPQIAIAGVGLALFALWMTAERMRQTQDQIKSITDNNRFNNFYKHRAEFVQYFRNKNYLILIASNIEKSLDDIIVQLYENFFYKNHSDFKPFINDFALTKSYEFINKLKASSLNAELIEVETHGVDEFKQLYNLIFFPCDFLKFYLTNMLNKDHYEFVDTPVMPGVIQKQKYYFLLIIFFSYRIIYDMMSFSGSHREEFFSRVSLNVRSFAKLLVTPDVGLE